ncbi:hypothetical protein WN51_11436 [Melipona quadrifasciata]|uniref:Uncharacterized protein n=1 Tax=Melipona quadrifasciata TaxID=166423 RepID=A0A0M9A981_9HYME|nr:hypothetical protein WN51_11436 [Melipona quadrifasciata]
MYWQKLHLNLDAGATNKLLLANLTVELPTWSKWSAHNFFFMKIYGFDVQIRGAFPFARSPNMPSSIMVRLRRGRTPRDSKSTDKTGNEEENKDENENKYQRSIVQLLQIYSLAVFENWGTKDLRHARTKRSGMTNGNKK